MKKSTCRSNHITRVHHQIKKQNSDKISKILSNVAAGQLHAEFECETQHSRLVEFKP